MDKGDETSFEIDVEGTPAPKKKAAQTQSPKHLPDDETSFEIDVEDIPALKKAYSVAKIGKKETKEGHDIVKIDKEETKEDYNAAKIDEKEAKNEDLPQELEVPVTPSLAHQKQVPNLEKLLIKKSATKLSNFHHEASVAQSTKNDSYLPKIEIDPVTVATVGAAVVAAGTAAVTTGVAAPAVTIAKVGILKIKAAMGLTSKAAVVVGGAAAVGVALVTLEKKFTDYEKDIQTAKDDMGEIGEQLKKLDTLLNSVKK